MMINVLVVEEKYSYKERERERERGREHIVCE
jgi:hypothetical protein